MTWRDLDRSIVYRSTVKEHLIAQGFTVVDLHLSEGRYMARSDSSDRALISAIDQEEL